MKTRIFIIVSLVAAIAYAGRSAGKSDPFSPAKDFPRGALVYAQFSDLPALVKRWNGSELKTKYLASQNFHDLANRHLGLKLASRWQEFSESVGFPFDLEAVAGFADGRASIAIYDIGKLDLVFIAPLSEELFAATALMQNSSRFETEDLGNDVTAYRIAVDADRGRQKQEILFTHIKGRLIVATSEKLLVKTIANVSGRSSKDRLSDEPGFSELSRKVTPHLATVWVDQAALNEDYYFKRYWLMKDPGKFRNVRAGVFDLSVSDDKVHESREFLLEKPEQLSAVPVADANALLSHVPAGASLFRMTAANSENLNDAIRVILAVPEPAAKGSGQPGRHAFFRDDSSSDTEAGSFRNLGSNFDENINDVPDEKVDINDLKKAFEISPILAGARPTALLSISEPRMLPKPLFAEFNYAVVVRLGAPAAFDRKAFESLIEKTLVERVMIPGASKVPAWTTQTANGIAIREVALPMLDQKISYAIAGNTLFLANSGEFLHEICEARNSVHGPAVDKAYSDLRVIDLKHTEEQFDLIFRQLEDPKATDNFFTGNIGSLIRAVPEGTRVEVKRSSSAIFAHEDVTMDLK